MLQVQQFRNIDSDKRPQVVSVEFSRVLQADDTTGHPEEQDAGFWPSKDPDAAGYVLPENFDSEMRKAKARMRRFNRGDWYYCGVVCRATVHVPIGGNSFTVYTIDSAGLWGIESDAGDYLDEVYREEESNLRSQLRDMGAAFLALPEKP